MTLRLKKDGHDSLKSMMIPLWALSVSHGKEPYDLLSQLPEKEGSAGENIAETSAVLCHCPSADTTDKTRRGGAVP